MKLAIFYICLVAGPCEPRTALLSGECLPDIHYSTCPTSDSAPQYLGGARRDYMVVIIPESEVK